MGLMQLQGKGLRGFLLLHSSFPCCLLTDLFFQRRFCTQHPIRSSAPKLELDQRAYPDGLRSSEAGLGGGWGTDGGVMSGHIHIASNPPIAWLWLGWEGTCNPPTHPRLHVGRSPPQTGLFRGGFWKCPHRPPLRAEEQLVPLGLT